MTDLFLKEILSFLNALPPEWIVVIISFFPIIELRGSLPVAMGLYEMSFWKAYSLSVLGNMLTVLPLLLLFQPLSSYMMRFKWYASFYNWLSDRTFKRSQQIEKFGALGLIIFVAVPIPTTGAWTACLAATLFNIRVTYAFFSILIGVMIAGIIVGIVTGALSYSIR